MASVLSPRHLRHLFSWRQLSKGFVWGSRGWRSAERSSLSFPWKAVVTVMANTAGVAPDRLVMAVTLELVVFITEWRMPSAWRWRSRWHCEWMAAADCGCWRSQSFGTAPGCWRTLSKAQAEVKYKFLLQSPYLCTHSHCQHDWTLLA